MLQSVIYQPCMGMDRYKSVGEGVCVDKRKRIDVGIYVDIEHESVIRRRT